MAMSKRPLYFYNNDIIGYRVPLKNNMVPQKEEGLEDFIVAIALEISSQLQLIWHAKFGCMYTQQLFV